jgi:hypothetical protein
MARCSIEVVAEVPAVESDGTCDSSWARTARTALASQTIGTRENYLAKTL